MARCSILKFSIFPLFLKYLFRKHWSVLRA